MITAEQINAVDTARVKLINCATEEAVENVFDEFKITDIDAKIAFLKRCMQLQTVFTIPGAEPLTKEKFYQEALVFFLKGPWRELI